MWRYRARWLLRGDGRRIDDGLLVAEAGRLIEIGSYRGEAVDEDLGDVAIVPGFFNAHVHLDLSLVERPAEAPRSFAAWLKQVVAARFQSSDPSTLEVAIQHQVDGLLAAGTTFIGDITTGRVACEVLATTGMAGILFQEVVGLRPERYDDLFEQAQFRNLALAPPQWPGISPHAPYSTSPVAYARCLANGLPLATHALESPDEMEFLRTGRGPMREFLESIGAWQGERPPTVEEWLDAWLLPDGAPRICVHGNQIEEAWVPRFANAMVAGRLAGVVWCPRTSAWFGHGPHPWRRLQAAGIPVALGTDSLASNPDLSVFEEARYLAAKEDSPSPEQLLAMLTEAGAKVLGQFAERGTLDAGKRADWVVLEPGEPLTARSIAGLFHPATRVLARSHHNQTAEAKRDGAS